MDRRDPNSPSDPSTPNPVNVVVAEGSEPDRGGAGIDRKSENFMDGVSAMWSGFCTVVGWLWNGGRRNATRFVAWNREDRRNVGITVLSVAVLVLGFIAYNGHDSTTGNPQPPQPVVTTAQPSNDMYVVVDGDNWDVVAKKLGTTANALREANPTVVRDNTAWCKARVIDGKPISDEYLAGLLPDGKTLRKTSFCQLFSPTGKSLSVLTVDGGLALTTLRPKQRLVKPTNSSGPALVDSVVQAH